ncbi:hypothetical protein HNQ51_003010 [Inhella inkyongensis]|uniref:NAD(P)-binding domain-containing protein n=1 Tax=Inhella inkyongensis TaxID=392593 RepID=A0A840S7N4_9BURK|nr:NAD(P)H-binding protein [Inhella inkyongensis]MBB5205683.1 hypothetical protein [Inhella inkyongensis]
MKVVLIGATGFVGSALLQELLARGHQVLALARNSAKLAPQEGMQALQADVMDPEAVAAAAAQADAVISAFNPGWTHPALYEDTVRGYDAIAQGVAKAGRRLLVVGGAGSLYVAPGLQLVDTPEFPAEWKAAALAAREVLKRLQSNRLGLAWSYVSPPAHLVPGERTGNYRLGQDDLLTDAQGHSSISVADLAVALVDELGAPAHQGKRFTVAY